MSPSNKINVAYLAVEAEPLVKVGGLGDVAGSLPFALNRLPSSYTAGRGLDTRLFLPFHGAISASISPSFVDKFEISTGRTPEKVEVYQYNLTGVPVYLISGRLFSLNDPIYTADNRIDGEKYIFFTVAALEFLRRHDWIPAIVHANDWHTAISAYVISQDRNQPPAFFSSCRTVLSVHNLPYTGKGAHTALAHFQVLPPSISGLPGWMTEEPLPIGLLYADSIVAVSPTYAQEILTPEFGCSMQSLLASRKTSLSGILNGIDYRKWDPATDSSLAQTFTPSSLDRRAENKQELLRQLDLADQDSPLLVYISRMDQQKSVDLAFEALRRISHLSWNAVFLGTGSPDLMQACRDLQAEFPHKVRAVLQYDASLARRLYAAGDILLMPSRYEPCGLSQMIAMRYGCVPLARATGGLKDTIIDFSDSRRGTGFLFEQADAQALAQTLLIALQVYKNKALWRRIQLKDMRTDFSWKRSAVQYAQTYLKLLENSS